jgi:hypothetical protein
MGRAWGVHAIVLAGVLGATLAWIAASGADLVLVAAFVWMPLALVYTALSTALVALLRPGRGWVALAHAVALALAAFAPLLFVKSA